MATLAPELAVLPDRHRLIWADPDARHQALEAIVSAWERGTSNLAAQVTRVDDAVVAALDALGLPRGPAASVEVRQTSGLWTGRKLPDCRLLLNGEVLRHVLRQERNPDDLLRTWVHESLHGRQPFHAEAATEALLHTGYEEGMAEGLARYVVRDMAGLHPLERSYRFYVDVYEALASLLGTSPVALWHDLWRHPAGQVRAWFADAIDRVCRQAAGESLSIEQRGRLRATADRLFARGRRDDAARRDAMLALWRTVLR